MGAIFAEPYIDIDTWRDTPVAHRYIHGGFKGTNTRFSFYFPPKSQYQGRFFQHVTPVPDSENLAQQMPPGAYNKIGFAIASGAYFVETNGGGQVDLAKPQGGAADPSVTAYRANAAAAAYSRAVARAIYADTNTSTNTNTNTIYTREHQPYGYLYGGSGGGYRTIGAMENTQTIWDGAVPYVIGSTMAIPNMFTVRMHAMRVLRHKFPYIVDALEPGGSGDPYAELSDEEADALREVTQMGFPPGSWFGYKNMGVHGFAALYQGVKMADPSYFTDFWSKPGYLGHDNPERLQADRIQFTSTIAEVITRGSTWYRQHQTKDGTTVAVRGGVDNAFQAPTKDAEVIGFRLAETPPETYFLGGDLHIGSGDAQGRTLTLDELIGDTVTLGIADADIVEQVQPGDTVTVDNADFLASQTYHRHQVPDSGFPVWDQFRDASGQPLYPQRPMLLGPLFVQATSGSTMTGQFSGKMIVVASLWDREAMPWQADWYRQQVQDHWGANADEHFRLYYTEHALHGDEPELEDPSRVVSYQGMLQQALRDLAAWVEQGVPPPQSSQYQIVNGQVVVPAEAQHRRGLQATVDLTVNGGKSATIEAGEAVNLAATVSAPPKAGVIVGLEWDFQGQGHYQAGSSIDRPSRTIEVTRQRRFEQPGTYFVTLRAASRRQPDEDSPYALIHNLDRVRIVVTKD